MAKMLEALVRMLLAALAPMEMLGRLLDGFGLAFAGRV